MPCDLVTVNPMVLNGSLCTSSNKITFQGPIIDTLNHKLEHILSWQESHLTDIGQ